jgi:hypothetical protein
MLEAFVVPPSQKIEVGRLDWKDFDERLDDSSILAYARVGVLTVPYQHWLMFVVEEDCMSVEVEVTVGQPREGACHSNFDSL